MNVVISDGNSKLGRIPNISLPPVLACAKGVPCSRSCYAFKAYRMYPAVQKAWEGNLKMALERPVKYFDQIAKWLLRTKKTVFRWHVAGDILDQRYLNNMIQIAEDFPKIRFLAFTKRYELDYGKKPDNLSILFSMWPRYGDVDKEMPRAWYFNSSDPDWRIPPDAFECTGKCEECFHCWGMKPGDNLVLKHH